MDGKVNMTLTANGAAKLLNNMDIHSCRATNGKVATHPPKMLFQTISIGKESVKPLAMPTTYIAQRYKICITKTSSISNIYLAANTFPLVTGSASNCFQPPA